ncbi:CDP-diacylglycerol diphosphatase [Chlorella sorokiniana]|uniref:CDP-diacylglycerol diphosphatase n=1 Tax=Chlorella sorokiniana TaxID=3076 RepID=A0A2P6TQB2_CHLSO|nr:CDP-diacylglycerol diphosphatase [Chlorella sorokiniana]|eukprot:PRW56202.1 CDP-diacylglycerol diphosphatase [Chlorella sorokiniana]
MSLRACLVAVCAALLASQAAAYAPGICQPQCGSKRQYSDSNSLPGEACSDDGPCGALIFPGSDPQRNTTRCLEDFELTCDKQRGCAGCSLWHTVETCGTLQQTEECTDRPAFILLQAVEGDANTGLPCLTQNHWMLVPKVPCTGVESADPACTGRQGELWWSRAFAEATQSLNFSLAANATPWAVMAGSAVRRSQHQMHLRIDELATGLDTVQELERLAAAGLLSNNASEPTLIDSSETVGSLAAVFVPAPQTPEAIAQIVRPWATASTLAQAYPDNPHGVLLAPCLVPAADGSGEEEGFIVAAVFDTNSSEMQVEGDSCTDGGTPLPNVQPDASLSNSSGAASSSHRRGAAVTSLAAVAAALTHVLL